MPTVKLTDAAVQRFKAPPGARVDFFDAAFPGLALRVTGAVDQRPERRTWSLFYRYAGKQRRLTFEPGYPALSLADARNLANRAKVQLQAGVDPGEQKAKTKTEAARPADTVASTVELFIQRSLEAKGRAPRYVQETRRLFRLHVLPRWGDRDIRSITRRDVIELLDEVMDRGSALKEGGKRRTVPGGPIAANRTLAAVRALFNWALRRGVIDASPVTLVERPGEETQRDRTLTAEELMAIWEGATELAYPFGPYFQIVLLTGQRRDEVARMRWTDLDLENGIWSLTAEATKAGRSHIVPLAPLAVDILKALPRKATGSGAKPSDWVFSSSGDQPISGFSKAKLRLEKVIVKARAGQELQPWRIHDLRRTVATGLGRNGVTRFVIGKVLNHSDRSVTGIYDRYEYLTEKRHALEAWASYVESLLGTTDPSLVPVRAIR